MSTTEKTCHNCGVQLDKDPNVGGTNSDGSISDTYCSFCFQNGTITSAGKSLARKIAGLIENAVINMGMTECEAKKVADNYSAKCVR